MTAKPTASPLVSLEPSPLTTVASTPASKVTLVTVPLMRTVPQPALDVAVRFELAVELHDVPGKSVLVVIVFASVTRPVACGLTAPSVAPSEAAPSRV